MCTCGVFFPALQWRWPCWLGQFRFAAILTCSASCWRKLLATSPGNSNKPTSEYNIISFINKWNTLAFLVWKGRQLSALWRKSKGWGVAQASHRHRTGCELFSFYLKKPTKNQFLGNAGWSGLCLGCPHNPLASKQFIMPVRLWWVMYYSSRLVPQCRCYCLASQGRPGNELAWSSSVLYLLLKAFQGKSLWQKAFMFIN